MVVEKSHGMRLSYNSDIQDLIKMRPVIVGAGSGESIKLYSDKVEHMEMAKRRPVQQTRMPVETRRDLERY